MPTVAPTVKHKCHKHAEAAPNKDGKACSDEWKCASCRVGAKDATDCLSCVTGYILTDVGNGLM